MRKLHIHGSKAEVDAAVYQVTALMDSAPANIQLKAQTKVLFMLGTSLTSFHWRNSLHEVTLTCLRNAIK